MDVRIVPDYGIATRTGVTVPNRRRGFRLGRIEKRYWEVLLRKTLAALEAVLARSVWNETDRSELAHEALVKACRSFKRSGGSFFAFALKVVLPSVRADYWRARADGYLADRFSRLFAKWGASDEDAQRLTDEFRTLKAMDLNSEPHGEVLHRAVVNLRLEQLCGAPDRFQELVSRLRPSTDDIVLALTADTPLPDHLLMTQELQGIVRDAIEQLPSEWRFCVQKHFLEYWTYGRISENLECTENAARLRTQRALGALAQVLRNILSDGRGMGCG